MDWGANITIQGGCFTTAINAAASHGRYRMVKRLLGRDLQTDLMKTQTWEAIRTAARHGYAEVITLLLERSLVTAEQEGHEFDLLRLLSDSLLIAAKYGHATIVKLVLERGADIAARDEYNNNALHIAAISQHVEVTKILLERGASTTARGEKGGSSLYWAAYYETAEIVILLLDHDAEINAQTDFGSTALYIAIQNHHQQVVDILLASEADVNIGIQEGWKPIHLAAELELVNILPTMIAKGADLNTLNSNGRSPLHVTVTSGQKVALDVLLQAGAEFMPDVDGNTPFMLAVDKLDLDLATSLFQAGAEVNCRNNWGFTPLLTAILSQLEEQNQQRLGVVKFLIEHGAVCSADKEGWTPLHLAALRGYDAILTLLLDRGHDVNAQAHDGETPLWFAVRAGKHDIARQLMCRGADTKVVSVEGVSLLYFALEYRDPGLVRSLLISGCDPTLRDSDGDTPLRRAVKFAIDELIEDLIRHGAQLSAMDNLGMTCLDWLKRLRPDSQILNHAYDSKNTGPDVNILSSTMCKLSLRVRHDEKNRKKILYRLSRGLLMLDMEDDAELAYQAYFLAGDSTRATIVCDTCENIQTRDDSFYTCRSCLDTDLCHECMSKHEKQPMLDLCRDHKFLRVVIADARLRPDQTEAFDEWLLSIVKRLQPLSSSEETDRMIRLTIDDTETSQTEKSRSQ